MPAQSLQFKFAIGTGTTTATSVAIGWQTALIKAYAPDGSFNFKSSAEKGDGYYGSSDGFHTASYTVTPNFVGTITIQATLAGSPAEADWFNVNDTSITYVDEVIPASTTTSFVNFTGNFVWVRALVQRADMDPNGSVLFINYNH